MKYDQAFFDQPVDRCCTACDKWDGLKGEGNRDLLPMWVADMDFRCADEIVEAINARAAHPVYGYTFQREGSVDAMLAFLMRRQGLSLRRDEQATIPCVVSGMKAAVLALTEPGDAVLVQPPVYGPFFSSVLNNGRKVARNPLKRDGDGRYRIDFDDLEAKLKAGVRLMMVCNPHNPVGRAWTRAELEQTWALCQRYGVTLIADEIHSGFVYETGAFTSALLLDEAKDARIAVLTSATKAFNIAGMRQATLLTRNREIKAAITGWMDRAGASGVNIFALTATEAAYRFGDAWLDALLSYLDAARALVKRELETRLPDAVLSPVEATYMAWIDLRAYAMTGSELMKATYEEGVALMDGAFFGREEGEGFLRLNFACPHSQAVKALELLERAVKKNARRINGGNYGTNRPMD